MQMPNDRTQTTNPYELAIDKLRPYLSRSDDGTFVLDTESARTLCLDPVIFADLLRSLEHTNEMIRRGEIKPEDVRDV
jgi:hypothetical protein